MPFGLRNDSATFERALEIILSGVPCQIYLIYLENVIVFSSNAAQHVNYDHKILLLLSKTGVYLKLNKFAFFKHKLDYLLHKIIPGNLEASSPPTKATILA